MTSSSDPHLTKPQYLGDAVYICLDPYGVVLTTGHHLEEEASQVIILEPEVVQALVKYIKTNLPHLC